MRKLMMGLLAGLATAACNDNNAKSDGDGQDRVNQEQVDRVKNEADRLEKKADAEDKRAKDGDNSVMKARAERDHKNADAMKDAADGSKKVDDQKWGDGVQGKTPSKKLDRTTK